MKKKKAEAEVEAEVQAEASSTMYETRYERRDGYVYGRRRTKEVVVVIMYVVDIDQLQSRFPQSTSPCRY